MQPGSGGQDRAAPPPTGEDRDPHSGMPPPKLARDPYRTAVEQLVSRQRGRRWAAESARDMTEFACHPCAILSDGAYSVFAKLGEGEDAADHFQIELAALQLLSDRAGIQTPAPIGIVPVPGGSILVMETVPAVDRAPRHWREIGRTLARIHRVKGKRFGMERDGRFGPLFQDNTPADDWPTFYAERRLLPGLRLAVDSGHLPPALARQVEALIPRLPELCGPPVVPALLHGDAQQNNFISTEQGAVAIDPAPYFGHPEMDLAALDYWQAVPGEVLEAYQDEMPIAAGFRERRNLWRVWAYLAAVTVEGAEHLGRLAGAVQPYL